MATKYVSIRLDQELFNKFRIIAAYEGRSLNKQVLVLIRNQVATFESQHGIIPLAPEQPNTP